MTSFSTRITARVRGLFAPPGAVLCSVASGLLTAAAFPPLSLGFIAFVALVPMLVALMRTSGGRRVFFRCGYLFGAAFFTTHLWWVLRLIPASSITLPWLMVPALVLMVAYLSLFTAAVFWLVRLLAPRGGPAFVLLVPASWVLVEVLRCSGELGFPWGSMGYALAAYPILAQPAALAGVFGLSGVVVLVNVLWASALTARRRVARYAWLVAGCGVIFGVAFGGTRAMQRIDDVSSEPVAIALAQPNVDLEVKWQPSFRDSTLRLIERLSRQAATLGAELIVFPETSAPVYMSHNALFRKRLQALAAETGAGVFIGFLDGRYTGPDNDVDVYNSSGLFTADGRLLQYSKTHLLPFGEAIPFAWKFRALKALDFGQANFQPGKIVRPLPSEAGALGPLICFESIFPGLSREFVASGADVLVNITNDGWFGQTPGPHQHAEMAILRAVENRRYLLRSANSGVSMVVDPAGRVLDSLGLGVQGLLFNRIHTVRGTSFYTRHGDAPLLALCVLMAAVGLGIGRQRVRREARLSL